MVKSKEINYKKTTTPTTTEGTPSKQPKTRRNSNKKQQPAAKYKIKNIKKLIKKTILYIVNI